ncbi:AhpD-like protein [Aspergillus avenaceus]|uniref:AhpD-like protein n=1 Tax=Aspergillus avenaceus TaxID=36643 RepID=A0A5N6TZU9_ASPAV|nr:AhpD-like protein [Aspergillus avenaceus]
MARLPYNDFRSHHTPPKYPTLNVLKLLSHSSATINHWADVGNAQFKHLSLSPRDRELVILLSTAKFRSTYEWTHHIPISTKAGVTDEERQVIQDAGAQARYFSGQKPTTKFNTKDGILLDSVETIIEHPEVGEELWARVKELFSDREIVEIISLQGFYYMFSRLTTVLEVDMDSFAKSKL